MKTVCKLLLLTLVYHVSGVYGYYFFYGRFDFSLFKFTGKHGYLFAYTHQNCHWLICQKQSNCVTTYAPALQRCYEIAISAQILLWACGKTYAERIDNCSLLVQDKFKYITDLTIAKTVWPPPKALWLLDNINQGKNMGTGGRLLNMPTQNVQYASFGPKYPMYRNLRYGIGLAGSASRIPLYQEGKLLLNLQVPFTITMWIKTRMFNSFMPAPLIEAQPKHATCLWLAPTIYRNQLSFCPDQNCAYTIPNNTKVADQWRHVAVVYRNKSDIKFYLEGYLWPVLHHAKDDGKLNVQPEELIFWHTKRNYHDYMYFGSLACVAIFLHPFSEKSIQNIRDSCP